MAWDDNMSDTPQRAPWWPTTGWPRGFRLWALSRKIFGGRLDPDAHVLVASGSRLRFVALSLPEDRLLNPAARTHWRPLVPDIPAGQHPPRDRVGINQFLAQFPGPVVPLKQLRCHRHVTGGFFEDFVRGGACLSSG